MKKKPMKEANIVRVTELSPTNDPRKSFYGKAKVLTYDDGSHELQSYDTIVSRERDGKVSHLGKYSQTTSRHQKEFEKQFGRKNESLMKESMSAQQLEKEINDAVDWLVDADEGCSTIKLDDRLAVCVGWQDGYDADDESLIHSKSDPSWVIVAGIKVWTSDDMRTDFDWINSPYYENGDVLDNDVSLPADNPGSEASWLLKAYEEIQKVLQYDKKVIEKDGKIVDDPDYEESLKEDNNEESRYKAVKRTAIDGKEWWVVYDTKENKYSTDLRFGKYRTKKDAETKIKLVQSIVDDPDYEESLKESDNKAGKKISKAQNDSEAIAKKYDVPTSSVVWMGDDKFTVVKDGEQIKVSSKDITESKNRGKGTMLKESYDDYNYYEAVEADVREALENDYADVIEGATDEDEAYEELYDKLWVDDSVTGNASGSYTFNTYKAEEYICHNLELLCEAIEEFGGEASEYKRCLESPETADVTIRCYLLGQVLREVLSEYEFGEEE